MTVQRVSSLCPFRDRVLFIRPFLVLEWVFENNRMTNFGNKKGMIDKQNDRFWEQNGHGKDSQDGLPRCTQSERGMVRNQIEGTLILSFLRRIGF